MKVETLISLPDVTRERIVCPSVGFTVEGRRQHGVALNLTG